MTTLTFRGDQIAEALQFDDNAGTTTVEIGRTWFSATDTVTVTFGPGAFDATGALVGGAGIVTGLTVTTAAGQVTNFGATTGNPLDVDPDPSKNGGDFFYISESPQPGNGGAYAGLQLEKIVVADITLAGGTSPVFSNAGYFVPAGGVTPPPGGGLTGTDQNDSLTGTRDAELMQGLDGNDSILSLGGKDSVFGGDGNDIVDGGGGADSLNGGRGNDLLWGAKGNDRLTGGEGGDLLDGGAGNDQMTGGIGGDKFVFGAGDRVLDFDRTEGDQILFDAALGLTESDLIISATAQGTVIGAAGADGTMLLRGYFGGFDTGNDFKFDYMPDFDFI